VNAVPVTRPLLLADHGCPFAHRILALLDHLGVAHEVREVPRGQRPEGLERWSPSGRIPFLVHGDLGIAESRVILEHLSEAYAFEDAYPTGLVQRSMHREAMAIVDAVIVPNLVGDRSIPVTRLDEYVDRIAGVARTTPPSPCLLTFHLAPMWLRLQWWRPEGTLAQAIRKRAALVEWLDSTTRLGSVVKTCPAQTRPPSLD
jgi:glutathione S-transferase